MGVVDNVRCLARVVSRTRLASVPENARLLARRPAIAFGVGSFETGLLLSARVPARLRALAVIKTSALVGCPF